jgi:hypothetical protein
MTMARSAGHSIVGDGFEIRPVGEAEMAALLAVYRECEDFLALGPLASEQMIRGDRLLSSKAKERVNR